VNRHGFDRMACERGPDVLALSDIEPAVAGQSGAMWMPRA
jgi:hypothetical protein